MTMLPFTIKVSADEAEADTLRGALVAAFTLVEDCCRATGMSRRAVRESIFICRAGMYDGAATMLARRGHLETGGF